MAMLVDMELLCVQIIGHIALLGVVVEALAQPAPMVPPL
jgi:hypothetical protein